MLGQSPLKHGELEKTVLATAAEFPVMGQADRCVEVITQCHFWQIQAKYYRASSSKRNCNKIINKINRKPHSRLFLQPNKKLWFNLYLTWKKAQQETGSCHHSFLHSAHQLLIWWRLPSRKVELVRRPCDWGNKQHLVLKSTSKHLKAALGKKQRKTLRKILMKTYWRTIKSNRQKKAKPKDW